MSCGELTSHFGEELLDFVIDRKSTNFSLRENDLAVDHNVELAGFARLHLDFLTKAGIK